MVAALTLFALVNFPDALLLLRAHQLGLSTAAVIAAYALYNLTYAAASYPAGALSDRLPRRTVYALGLLFFAAGYLGLAYAHQNWQVFTVLALYGGFNACTDGVGKAWISTLVPDHAQGTAQGLSQALTGIGVLAAGIWAGLAWNDNGRTPLATFGDQARSPPPHPAIQLATDRRTPSRQHQRGLRDHPGAAGTRHRLAPYRQARARRLDRLVARGLVVR
ncbi:MFS transporter [Streptomyces sp. NPDC058000]|uniref:MFS transporter n=1 Tax=Streptomyces sp. NPDC058000 TaxID=3346299 RepID=UPI0036E9A9BF